MIAADTQFVAIGFPLRRRTAIASPFERFWRQRAGTRNHIG
jgi:hypothetical protein